MNLQTKYQKNIETFLKVCHRLAQHMYVTGYGGNLAWKLEEDVYKKTSSLWALANADARVRVRVNMLITKWEKQRN